MSDEIEPFGGEPYWLGIFKMADDEYATAAVEAPDEETATAESERVVVGNEGREPNYHMNTRGPFPRFVRTDEREIRPSRCHGCGLDRYCGNHPPIAQQTWWELREDLSDDERRAWECIQCKTMTVLEREGETTHE